MDSCLAYIDIAIPEVDRAIDVIVERAVPIHAAVHVCFQRDLSVANGQYSNVLHKHLKHESHKLKHIARAAIALIDKSVVNVIDSIGVIGVALHQFRVQMCRLFCVECASDC